jgi:hypothetical protein
MEAGGGDVGERVTVDLVSSVHTEVHLSHANNKDDLTYAPLRYPLSKSKDKARDC